MLDETERGVWNVVPLESVGPLRFGMSHEEVVHATGSVMRVSSEVLSMSDSAVRAEFALIDSNPLMPASTLSTYYDEGGLLSAVAVDARSGPQAVLDGMRLVGRVPSEIEMQFAGYVESRSLDLLYSEYWDMSSEAVGVVLRAQRVDDVVLSRPIFVGRSWAERCGNASDGRIPQFEWHRQSR
ncbi:hypothetical protein ABZZ44_15610 [Streptomyces sp. NPDC006460]|uniref:hypothetical protein n=1 Tax=Streptomyces sp. NPDC006460 TaxID=3154304 RepID=UPI0033A0A1C1